MQQWLDTVLMSQFIAAMGFDVAVGEEGGA